MKKKRRSFKGKNHPRYIDGRSLKQYFCLCGQPISRSSGLYGTGKCMECGSHDFSGSNNPAWKSGRKKSSGGYWQVWMPEHPYADSKRYILEHRLVMEKKLGRYLKRDEIVHHLNGNIIDNRPENLVVTTQKKHIIYIKLLQDRILKLEEQLNAE